MHRPHIDRTDLIDETWLIRAEIGRLYPFHVDSLFEAHPAMERQCLIPHRRVREESWMYVFDRGPNWQAGMCD